MTDDAASTAGPPFPLPPDDFLTAVSKALAEADRPPRIVTFSRAPTDELMSHAFGPDAVSAMVLDSEPDARADPEIFDPARLAVAPRFMDAVSLRRIALGHRAWLDGATAVVTRFPPGRIEGWDPVEAGFAEAREFGGPGGRPIVLLARPRAPRPPAPAAAKAGRPALRRLVIVDPCLGGARGHYLPYALRLSEGARAAGATIVWACHRGLAEGSAPADVVVRRSFDRCFFDVEATDLATTDLGPELAAGWAAVLDEFDAADTHFLVHSADAHLLRAAAAVLAARPDAASVLHVICHTSPRRMAGRAAGDEAHRVLMRLRRSAAFGRSLLLWSETRRLGRWLADWLDAPVPTIPYLSPTDPGAPPLRRAREAMPRKGSSPASGSPLRLAVLGESRAAKGFLDLPELMDALAARPALAGAVRVSIQDWASFRGPVDPHREAVERLRAHPFVTIVEGELEAEAYLAALAGADALLLPYHADIYGLRGSGIFVEGLSRGLVAVIRAGGSMEDAADEGVVLRYEDPEGFAEAVERLTVDRDKMLDAAADLAARFREANTPARYVAALDRRAWGGPG